MYEIFEHRPVRHFPHSYPRLIVPTATVARVLVWALNRRSDGFWDYVEHGKGWI